MEKGEEFLGVMKETIDDIIASPRWEDNGTPMPGGILELATRINNGDQYRTIRENKKLELLLSVIEVYEESLNDDWMPYKIMELDNFKALSFIKRVALIIKESSIDEFNKNIIEAYNELKL